MHPILCDCRRITPPGTSERNKDGKWIYCTGWVRAEDVNAGKQILLGDALTGEQLRTWSPTAMDEIYYAILCDPLSS